jgi:hypothetical protein
MNWPKMRIRSNASDVRFIARKFPEGITLHALGGRRMETDVKLHKAAPSYDKAEAEVLALRGRAFLPNHQPHEAEQEFQAAMKLRSEGVLNPSCRLAQLDLARAYAMEEGHGEGASRVSGLFCYLERRRLRFTAAERDEGLAGEAAIAENARKVTGVSSRDTT